MSDIHEYRRVVLRYLTKRDMNFLNEWKKEMSHEWTVEMFNSLMELRPEKVVDKLTPPILIICCLVLENEVCK